MNYIKNKRGEKDYCNICGKLSKLTWDHVPPKSSGNSIEVNVNHLYSGIPTNNNYQKRFQSGIKYRSLCSECNNNILGKYDMSYKNFVNSIKDMLRTSVTLPYTVHIQIEINKVCRAVCGHFLAAKNFYDNKGHIDQELRMYVLDEQYALNSAYNLYYWIYPYKTTYIIRDSVVKSYSNKVKFPANVISSWASYPIAFILAIDPTDNCGLNNLLSYTTNNIADVIDVPIDFRSSYYPGRNEVRDFLWPFNIGDDPDDVAFIVGGDAMNDSLVGITK